MKKAKRKLLILSTGRSGTKYVAKLFTKAGLAIGHEQVHTGGTATHFFFVDRIDTSMFNQSKAPIHSGENREDYQFERVWYQVRNPLKTVDSIAKCFNHKMRLWSHNNLGVDLPGTSGKIRTTLEDKIRWAVKYITTCHKLGVNQADKVYQVEQIAHEWPNLLTEIGLPPCSVPKVSVTTNRSLRFAFKSKDQSAEIRRTMYQVTWSKLNKLCPSDTEELRDFAERFGYK